MKKVRAATAIALATTAYRQLQDYARENPERTSSVLGSVETFLREKAPPQYSSKIDGGGAALRRHLGLPARPATPPSSAAPFAGPAPTTEVRKDATGFDPSI